MAQVSNSQRNYPCLSAMPYHLIAPGISPSAGLLLLKILHIVKGYFKLDIIPPTTASPPNITPITSPTKNIIISIIVLLRAI